MGAMAHRHAGPAALAMMIAAHAGCSGCERDRHEVPPLAASASPQASAEPAPLAHPPASAAGFAARIDAGGVVVYLRPDAPVPADGLPTSSSGYGLDVVWAPKPIVQRADGKGDARDAGSEIPTWRVVLTPMRLKMEVAGPPSVLEDGTKLLARADAVGYALEHPKERGYHVVAPTVLRALIAERRFDASPVAFASVEDLGPGPKRLGLPTRRVRVTNGAGKVTIDIARVVDTGLGGALFCRALTDLLSAPAELATCDVDEIPLFAEFTFRGGAGLIHTVTTLVRRVDIRPEDDAMPSRGRGFLDAPLPPRRSGTLASRARLAEIAGSPSAPRANVELGVRGLRIDNVSDALTIVTVDGHDVGWVAAGGSIDIEELDRGEHVVGYRPFFGAPYKRQDRVRFPVRLALGGDGGTAK